MPEGQSTRRNRPVPEPSPAPDSSGGPLPPWLSSVIAVLLTLACLWVLLSKQYDSSTQNWAAGVLGTILGQVLRYGTRG